MIGGYAASTTSLRSFTPSFVTGSSMSDSASSDSAECLTFFSLSTISAHRHYRITYYAAQQRRHLCPGFYASRLNMYISWSIFNTPEACDYIECLRSTLLCRASASQTENSTHPERTSVSYRLILTVVLTTAPDKRTVSVHGRRRSRGGWVEEERSKRGAEGGLDAGPSILGVRDIRAALAATSDAFLMWVISLASFTASVSAMPGATSTVCTPRDSSAAAHASASFPSGFSCSIAVDTLQMVGISLNSSVSCH